MAPKCILLTVAKTPFCPLQTFQIPFSPFVAISSLKLPTYLVEKRKPCKFSGMVHCEMTNKGLKYYGSDLTIDIYLGIITRLWIASWRGLFFTWVQCVVLHTFRYSAKAVQWLATSLNHLKLLIFITPLYVRNIGLPSSRKNACSRAWPMISLSMALRFTQEVSE